ncbi:MAG TPA: ATP-binding protein [Phototrophicaceae bacterium]|nr:ATP-binding protein [Phototrophicaceae bacterium]
MPTFLVVLVLAMISAYAVARSLPSGAEMSRVNILLGSERAISGRANSLYSQQQNQAQQLAQSQDVAAALSQGQVNDLQALLTNFARRADLDGIILTDANGQYVYGVMRPSSTSDYAPAQLQDVSAQMLLSMAPVSVNGTLVGTAYVGMQLTRWLDSVRADAAAEIAIYQGTQLLATTVKALPAALPAQYVAPASSDAGAFQALDLNGSPYLGAYFPLDNTRAVIAVFVPDNAPFAAEAGQQLVALTLATVAAGVIITLFVMTNLFIERVNRVRQVAEALAEGDLSVRTNMQPTDEIGALGHAIDVYTDRVQQRHDTLRASLRRQRREIEHLNAVLESLPDGVVIQDLDGSVTFINEHAKRLIGEGYNFFKRAELRDITAAVTDTLGPAFAPGLYSLGAPQRLELDDRMLQVQTFAVTSLADQRVGTVIIVRDVTVEAQRERAQAALLDEISLRTRPETSEMAISKEIRRNVGALQKLIVEMREMINSTDAQYVQQTMHALPLETLVWSVANEWKQVAQAANLSLNVSVEQSALYIRGDERRLRWALGNIVDNAIKYTPPGGKVSLEIKGEEDGFARLRIRDTGVGIAADELPHVFTRFYRGTPLSTTGRTLRVPGTGQGLTIARQIIETHGGRIYLRSSVGVGTAVYLALPLVIPETVEIEDEAEAVQVR